MQTTDPEGTNAPYRAALDIVRDHSPLLALTIDRHVANLNRRLDERRHDEPPGRGEDGVAGAGECPPGSTS